MAWNLKGQMIESCSCNMFCPCWFGAGADDHGPGLVRQRDRIPHP